MSETVAVVVFEEVAEEAYEMGYSEFATIRDWDVATEFSFEFDPFTETARWANIVAPDLRALAGYADGGKGTYTTERDVAVIDAAEADDVPAEAALLSSMWVHDALVTAFRQGAEDAAAGSEKGTPEVSL